MVLADTRGTGCRREALIAPGWYYRSFVHKRRVKGRKRWAQNGYKRNANASGFVNERSEKQQMEREESQSGKILKFSYLYAFSFIPDNEIPSFFVLLATNKTSSWAFFKLFSEISYTTYTGLRLKWEMYLVRQSIATCIYTGKIENTFIWWTTFWLEEARGSPGEMSRKNLCLWLVSWNILCNKYIIGL